MASLPSTHQLSPGSQRCSPQPGAVQRHCWPSFGHAACCREGERCWRCFLSTSLLGPHRDPVGKSLKLFFICEILTHLERRCPLRDGGGRINPGPGTPLTRYEKPLLRRAPAQPLPGLDPSHAWETPGFVTRTSECKLSPVFPLPIHAENKKVGFHFHVKNKRVRLGSLLSPLPLPPDPHAVSLRTK